MTDYDGTGPVRTTPGQQPRRETGVCPECGFVDAICLRAFMPGRCPVGRTGQQPAQPASLLRPASRASAADAPLPQLVVTRGDGIPLPDQKAALEEFKRQCSQPAQPDSGEVKRFKVPALYVPYPFAEVADKDGLATVVLADAFTAAAQQRIAELEAERDELYRALDAVIAEAARYRWLRGDCPDHSIRWTQWEVRRWAAPRWTSDLRHTDLDAAIDAAIAMEPPK